MNKQKRNRARVLRAKRIVRDRDIGIRWTLSHVAFVIDTVDRLRHGAPFMSTIASALWRAWETP